MSKGGGRAGSSRAATHSPADTRRERVYPALTPALQHSSRAIKLHKKYFITETNGRPIVKPELWWCTVRCEIYYTHRTVLRWSAGEDIRSDSLPCSVRVVGAVVEPPGPAWRPTSTYPTTWKTSGRRTSTRWVDLAVLSAIKDASSVGKIIVPPAR